MIPDIREATRSLDEKDKAKTINPTSRKALVLMFKDQRNDRKIRRQIMMRKREKTESSLEKQAPRAHFFPTDLKIETESR